MLANICPRTSSMTMLLSSWEFQEASVLAMHQVPPHERSARRRHANTPALRFSGFPWGLAVK